MPPPKLFPTCQEMETSRTSALTENMTAKASAQLQQPQSVQKPKHECRSHNTTSKATTQLQKPHNGKQNHIRNDHGDHEMSRTDSHRRRFTWLIHPVALLVWLSTSIDAHLHCGCVSFVWLLHFVFFLSLVCWRRLVRTPTLTPGDASASDLGRQPLLQEPAAGEVTHKLHSGSQCTTNSTVTVTSVW